MLIAFVLVCIVLTVAIDRHLTAQALARQPSWQMGAFAGLMEDLATTEPGAPRATATGASELRRSRRLSTQA